MRARGFARGRRASSRGWCRQAFRMSPAKSRRQVLGRSQQGGANVQYDNLRYGNKGEGVGLCAGASGGHTRLYGADKWVRCCVLKRSLLDPMQSLQKP